MRKLWMVAVLSASLAWGQAPAGPVDNAVDLFKRGLADTNPERRRLAAVALSGAGVNQKSLDLLYDAMANDKDPEVRVAAATSLGEMKARPAIPKLKAAMDGDPQVSFAAARALWLMGDRSGKELIEDVAMAQRKNPTGFMAQAKLEMNRKVHDPNGLAKMGAEQAAGALLGPFSIGLKGVTELTKDSGAQGRLLAISMLSQTCDPEAVSAIQNALEDDKNEIVRAGAAKAIGICGTRKDIDSLSLLVSSEKYQVQLAAAAAVIKLSSPGPARTGSLKKK